MALGSNLGDRLVHLRGGVRAVADLVEVERMSSVWESAPVGRAGQPDFLNAVLVGSTVHGPTELLGALHAVEKGAGRTRSFENAPRTLDLDLILHGDWVVEEPGLTLPHPRFRDRSFVLAPLAEVAPERVDPVTGRTVEDIWRDGREGLPPVRVHAPPEALWRRGE